MSHKPGDCQRFVRMAHIRRRCPRNTLKTRTEKRVWRTSVTCSNMSAFLESCAHATQQTVTNRKELALVLLLCFVAALRVFIFSAGFPFFSNIDEDLHFDLITQYSHARLPRAFDPLKEESLSWIVPYASPEFLFAPDQFPGAKFPAPLWKQSSPDVEPEIAATKAAWSTEINFESSQPPLYYALAIAAAYLTKLSNLPLVAIALVAIIAKLWPFIRQRAGAALVASAALVLCTAIPIGAWVIWTKYQFGDVTGSAAKITLLGWTRKPFADWWQHPIFMPRGFWVCWWDVITSVWRGEVKWHGQP